MSSITADRKRLEELPVGVRPLRADVPFLRDLPHEAIPDFTNGPVVEIKKVEIIPEYRLQIKF